MPAVTREFLEELYREYNDRKYVSPDPLQFLYRYDEVADREVAGLVASVLAYGKVEYIIRSVEAALAVLGPSPLDFLREAPTGALLRGLSGLRHRFTAGGQLAELLLGAVRVIDRHGSLNACFRGHLLPGDETVVGALSGFVSELRGDVRCSCDFLVPHPDAGSACKRLNLFLRWMVRSDRVDPGGWTGVPASRLVVPLDTHMFRICRLLGFTDRRQADMRTALEVTGSFRALCPDDPVKYDFAITRLGMRDPAFVDTIDISHC